MSDLPSTEQTREALKHDVFLAELGGDYYTEGQETIIRIAQAYVDGRLVAVPKCPDCGGKGGEKWKWVGADVQDGWSCPSCGGTGVNPELIERMAAAIWKRRHDVPYRPGRARHNEYHDDYMKDARAALSAVFKETE